VDTNGIISTVAGSTSGFTFSGDGGPAILATFNNTEGVAIDANGSVVLADSLNARLRAVTSDQFVNSVAGKGSANFSGDGGPALTALLHGPSYFSHG